MFCCIAMTCQYHVIFVISVDHPCQNKNGGCSHLCFISPSSSDNYICACPSFMKLSSDSKSCILTDIKTTVAPVTESTKCAGYICQSTSQCIASSLVCDGKPDCPMHDDESNCKRTITSTKPTTQTVGKQTKSSFLLYVYIGIAVVLLLLIIIVIVIVYRRKRSKFDLR